MSKIWGGVGECILFSLNVVGLLHTIKKGAVQDALYRSGVRAGEIINLPPPPCLNTSYLKESGLAMCDYISSVSHSAYLEL